MKRIHVRMIVGLMAGLMLLTSCEKEFGSDGDGVLPGSFSVSATRQVRFSQGNLQYKASNNTWRFAEYQYEYVGNANSNISSSYNGWIDLFGWGTSGWNSGAGCYEPWSTSTSWMDYYPGGSSSIGLTGAYAGADWAWYNAIRNGGNTAHWWRTLTHDEWDYLLNTRADAASKRGTGNIDGVGGLIILPDSWTLPMGCSFTAGFGYEWTRNSYTLAQWKQMEAAGAVFLPAAGDRYGAVVRYVGNHGYYWASTPYNDYECANEISFYGAQLFATVSDYRSRGFSVRPVR